MIHKNDLYEKIKIFSKLQIDIMSDSSPMIKIFKPVISRVVDLNILGMDKYINMIADKDGYIDAENILSEIKNNLLLSDAFSMDLPIVGDVIIGNGCIKMNIPVINQKLTFDNKDIDELISLIKQ